MLVSLQPQVQAGRRAPQMCGQPEQSCRHDQRAGLGQGVRGPTTISTVFTDWRTQGSSTVGGAPTVPCVLQSVKGGQAGGLTSSATRLSFSNFTGLPSWSSQAALTISRWLLQPRGGAGVGVGRGGGGPVGARWGWWWW